MKHLIFRPQWCLKKKKMGGKKITKSGRGNDLFLEQLKPLLPLREL